MIQFTQSSEKFSENTIEGLQMFSESLQEIYFQKLVFKDCFSEISFQKSFRKKVYVEGSPVTVFNVFFE